MRKIVLMLILWVMVYGASAQTNYYVATTGSNTNPGTFAEPVQTVQEGLYRLNPRDTLNIMPGTYSGSFILRVGKVTIRNGAPELPVLTGAGYGTAVIGLPDSLSDINIIGLELANNIGNDAQGIVIYGPARNITIANCKIHDIHFSANPNATVNANTNAQGIVVYGIKSYLFSSNLLITNNELYNCRLGYSEGIAVNGNIDGFEISNNYVHNLSNIGIDAIGHEGTCSNPAYDQARNGRIVNNRVHDCISPYATSGGIYIDGAKNIVIERNTTYHNGYGIEVGCENIGKSADSITVRNNFVYNNEVTGIALGGYDYPTGSGKVMNSIIESNTLFKNDYTNSGSGEMLVSYVEDAKVYNNIMYAGNQNLMLSADVATTNVDFDYNLYYITSGAGDMEYYWQGNTYTGLSAYQSGIQQDAQSTYANPEFVSAALPVPDLHLQNGSPCINSGATYTNDLNQWDIDGETRNNGRVDIGADEYYTTVGFGNVGGINAEVYPNPSAAMFIVKCNQLQHLEVYSIRGELILRSNNPVIDLSNQADGMYLLQLKTPTGQAVRRIVKQ